MNCSAGIAMMGYSQGALRGSSAVVCPKPHHVCTRSTFCRQWSLGTAARRRPRAGHSTEGRSKTFQIYNAFCTRCHYYESWGLGFRFLRSAPAKTSKSDSWYWCKNLISGILRDTALRPSLGQPVGCSTRSRAREQESACALQHEMLAIERSVLAELERVRGRNSTE